MLITFISNDVVMVVDFTGNLFNPIISILIPMFCKYSWKSQIKKKTNFLVLIHDIFIVLATCIIAVYATYLNFKKIIKKMDF